MEHISQAAVTSRSRAYAVRYIIFGLTRYVAFDRWLT